MRYPDPHRRRHWRPRNDPLVGSQVRDLELARLLRSLHARLLRGGLVLGPLLVLLLERAELLDRGTQLALGRLALLLDDLGELLRLFG